MRQLFYKFASGYGKSKSKVSLLFKNYFTDFYEKQKVKDKIIWTFKVIETVQQIPEDYLKYLEDTDTFMK